MSDGQPLAVIYPKNGRPILNAFFAFRVAILTFLPPTVPLTGHHAQNVA
jgi:hypothetical protein